MADDNDKPASEPLVVSSTSADDGTSCIPEEPHNGCDSTTEPPQAEPNFADHTYISLDSTEDTSSVEPPSETDAPKTSRELKSILALSKEAKLDTNLSTKRKSPVKKFLGFPVTAESELESFNDSTDEKSEKNCGEKSENGGHDKKSANKKRKSEVEGATSDETTRRIFHNFQGFATTLAMLKVGDF